MADLQKTIEIIFGGVDNLTQPAASAANAISKFSGEIENATQPFYDLAVGITQTETALAALGVATLAYAYGEAAELAEAEAGLQKVLSDSEGSVDQYAESIKELALNFGVMGTDVTDSSSDFKQAGFTIEESLKLVEVALTGVKIAELDSAEATQLIIANIRGLGVEAGEATHMMDAWNEVSNNYAATAGELAIATAELAPIAKTAGLSFDELLGLVTPMVEVLGSGSVASTALRSSLANLITSTTGVTSALAELKVNQHDANGELRSSGDILKDIGGVWDTLTESQQANYSLLLFGKENYSKMSILLNDFSKTVDITSVAINSQGSAYDELEVKLGTALAAQEKLSVAFNYAATTVGKQYIVATSDIVNSLADLVGAFDKTVANDGLKPLFDLMNPILDEFALNLDIIAKNLPEAFEGLDYQGLINSFKAIGAEFGVIFDGIDLTTVEGLHEALQTVIDGLARLNDLFAGVVSGFQPVLEAFKSIATEAVEAESSTAYMIGEMIGAGATVNVFAGVISNITGAIGDLADAVILVAGAKALGLLPSAAGNASTALGTLLSRLGPLTAAFAGGLGIGNMISDLTPIGGLLTDLFVGIDRLVGGPLSKAEEQIAKVAEAEKKAKEETENLTGSVEELPPVIDEVVESGEDFDKIVNDMAAESDSAAESTEALAEQYERMGLSADGSAKEIEKVTKASSDAAEKTNDFGDAASGAATNIDKTSEASKKAAESAKKAEIDFAKLGVELEKIASNERIKTMEFAVDLEIAQVEADAKKVVAAFDSIGESYAATSEMISNLYGEREDMSRFDQVAIDASIRQAEKIALEQHEAQIKLIEAQVENMEAQTDRLGSSDAMITVDGGDLQPELEAIMQSLFESIRIKMSADYQDFLFGLG